MAVTGWNAGTAADVGVGFALLGLGLLGWRLRPAARTGGLVTAAGVAWLLGDVTTAATFLHRGPLVHAALGHPTGRPRSTAARIVVPLAYLVALVFPLGRSDAVSLALAAAVLGVATVDFARSGGLDRPARAVALAAAGAVAAAIAVGPVARLLGVDARVTVLAEYDVLVLVSAAVVVADLVRGRWAQDVATGLVLDLGAADGTPGLRARLARAVGDPGLVVGYWLADEQRYVGEDGRPVDPAPDDAERVATPVTAAGEPLAVLVHDRHVLADPALRADVAAAARFAVANARLQAEVRAKVAAVEASRRRLVTAADDERRRLEERLRQGAERRLAEVEALLAEAGPPLATWAPQLAAARRTVHELALGLHPPSLSSGDLAGALRRLAAGSAVPVTLELDNDPVPPHVATAAYFVCAEAITNIAKYAAATRVGIRSAVVEDALQVVVADDGRGGADPAGGTGLRGLADRAEALGGSLDLTSPPRGGTRLTLRLPLDGAAPAVPAQPARPVAVGAAR